MVMVTDIVTNTDTYLDTDMNIGMKMHTGHQIFTKVFTVTELSVTSHCVFKLLLRNFCVLTWH
jgi:hypothetical protein